MRVSDDEFIGGFSEQCVHCVRSTLLRQENKWSCFSCGYSIKQKLNSQTTKEKN